MKVTVFILICLWCTNVHAGDNRVPLPTDRDNEKTVSAVAFSEGNDIHLEVAASYGGNHVDKVLALPEPQFKREDDGTTNAVDCVFDYTSDGFLMTSVVSRNGRPVKNMCGAQVEYAGPGRSNPIGLIWYIQIRERYSLGIYTNIDRLYTISAKFGAIDSNYVTTSVQVYRPGDLTGDSDVIKPENKMSVVGAVDGRVRLNDRAQLRVDTTIQQNREAALHPYGCYVYHCDYRYKPNGNRFMWIEDNGCSSSTNPFGLINTGFEFSGYGVNSAGQQVFRTLTKSFVIATEQPPNDVIYFTCYVNYCYGTVGSDGRCNGLCLYNSSLRRRRKRSILAEADQVSVTVRIYKDTSEGTTVNDKKAGKDKALSSSMIAVISAAGVIFVILAIFAAFIACYFCRRPDIYDEKQSSTNGSTSNLPSHLKEDHMWPNKI